MFPRISPLAVIALACAVSAQSKVVVPVEATRAEGDALSAVPFYTDRCRTSQYYGASLLRGLIPQGKMITELAYRRDGKALNTQLMTHSSTPAWQIRMGRYTRDARNPSTRYLPPGTTANTLTAVFQKGAMQFPNLPGGIGPMEFLIRFKLDRPFLFQGDGLVVDHYVYEARSRTFSYYVDAVRKSADFGSAVKYGESCPSDKNRASGISSHPGSTRPLSLLLHGAPAQGPVVAMIGSSRTQWGPVRLPLSLDPIGLTGCSLYTGIDLMIPTTTFSSGAADFSLRVPESPGFAGLKIYGQWLVIDTQANPPFRMSNGVEFTIGRTIGSAGLDASIVYGAGNIARSTYGFLDAGISLVTQFTWQ